LLSTAVRGTDADFSAILEQVAKDFGIDLIGTSEQLDLMAQRTNEATAALIELTKNGAVLSAEFLTIAGLLQGLNPSPTKFAEGGFVPGSGVGDRIPALLEPGEFVVPRHLAEMQGEFLSAWIRSGRQPSRYALGGFVTSSTGINSLAAMASGRYFV